MTTKPTAAALLREMSADTTRRRPTAWTATARAKLIDALEDARKQVCAYGPNARTCDCKYGLIPGGFEPRSLGSEETGCPEIRDLIRLVRAEQAVSAPESGERP